MYTSSEYIQSLTGRIPTADALELFSVSNHNNLQFELQVRVREKSGWTIAHQDGVRLRGIIEKIYMGVFPPSSWSVEKKVRFFNQKILTVAVQETLSGLANFLAYKRDHVTEQRRPIATPLPISTSNKGLGVFENKLPDPFPTP